MKKTTNNNETYLEIKDNYSEKEHKRKIELMNLRYKMTLDLVNLKDKIATKRHDERCYIMTYKIKGTKK